MSCYNVLLGTMKQRPRVFRDIVFTCVVLHNMLRTHQGGADRAPSPGNEQVVHVPKKNYRNPLREAKHQQKLLKDCFNHVGAFAGQENRI